MATYKLIKSIREVTYQEPEHAQETRPLYKRDTCSYHGNVLNMTGDIVHEEYGGELM